MTVDKLSLGSLVFLHTLVFLTSYHPQPAEQVDYFCLICKDRSTPASAKHKQKMNYVKIICLFCRLYHAHYHLDVHASQAAAYSFAQFFKNHLELF